MDIGKALSYTFSDERWIVKLVIGGLLMLFSWLIVPLIFVIGYLVRIVRNVMAGFEHPLPEWDEWGDMFRDGLNLGIAYFIYMIPIWILACCSLTVLAPAGFTEGDVSEMMAVLGGGTSLLLMCLMGLFALLVAVLGPAITIQYAREGSIGACLQVGEVINITRTQLGNIILALLVLFGLNFVLGLLGIIPIVGWVISLAASIYSLFVTGHLYGQIGTMVGGSPKEKMLDAEV